MSATSGNSVWDKIKAFSITHIISIAAILGGLLGTNYIYLTHFPSVLADSSNVFFLVMFDSVSVVGMSYYAVNFAISATGASIATQPATPTPAQPLAGVSQQTPDIQQLVSAVQALVAQKTQTGTQTQSPPAA